MGYLPTQSLVCHNLPNKLLPSKVSSGVVISRSAPASSGTIVYCAWSSCIPSPTVLALRILPKTTKESSDSRLRS
jgi:hypothetical protein